MDKHSPEQIQTALPSKPTSARAEVWTERARKLLENPDARSFIDLYLDESAQLGRKLDPESITILKGVAGEPWVKFTPQDRFGLALSGGGIRSATFNLGLLQALADLGILKAVDYLSTVSGGGYVGGFWTAWLTRKGQNPGDARFPLGNDNRGGERAEIRHLREFSRFLLPRVGLLQTEFWGIVMTVLGGLIPSLIAALAMLFLYWIGWVAMTGMLLWDRPAGSIALGGALVGYLLVSEALWAWSGKSEKNRPARVGYILGCLAGAALVVAGSEWRGELENLLGFALTRPAERVFAPALLLGAGTAVLLFVRVALARFFHSGKWVSGLEGFERTLTRFLGVTISFTAFGFLWWVSGKLLGGFAFPATAAGAVGSAALFAWAKKWLMAPVEETHGSTVLRTVGKTLKRATPKLLASLTWLLLFLLVGAAVHALQVSPHQFPSAPFYQVGLGALAIIFLTAWLFDPARVGMHEFYRSRISRCYMGASNFSDADGHEHERAAQNRQVIERPGDIVYLKELAEIARPVHLICTAANDVSGDSLATLYRGARSAVLSGQGISIGDQTAKLDDLRLSAALTASAAAFNSQMGRLSMDLGPAVTFLMSALNLRLGLWAPHPMNRFRGHYMFPGRFFLYELWGLSKADGKKHLHLSDGNHFENFGLYELIRRHVRYIIVSDCGADPEVAFDDLANVLRRVREDFGVEIELDISALRPETTGLTKQHAVVGTIHYNGVTGMDKGTIIFFKPTLTGDEPPDVLQYRTRNRAFPHESTGDQFYDEPQWESYRRLGEHAARTVFGSSDRPEIKVTNEVDKLFRNARSQWHPTPERKDEDFFALSERCASLEAELLATGPARLRAEVFAEITALAGAKAGALPGVEEEMAIFSFLLRFMQIMEDVWLCADLDHLWSHPLNEGWMSYFHRWASTPSFRRWWPILSPMYGLGFREFAKERFGVGVQDQAARPSNERAISTGQLTLNLVTNVEKFRTTHTWQVFQQRHPNFIIPAEARLFGYELELLGYDGALSGQRLVVGFVLVREHLLGPAAKTEADAAAPAPEKWAACWRSNELFMPRALHGSGMIARMLDAVIKVYEDGGPTDSARQFDQMEVRFIPEETGAKTSQAPEKPKVLAQAARQQRVQDIEFYKSRGFHYVKAENARTGEIILTLPLSDAG